MFPQHYCHHADNKIPLYDHSSPALFSMVEDNVADTADAMSQEWQLPDCVIASSNRFYDLLPFCTNLYYTEPQKWGCILPWEFPQNGSKKVEEEFLRKYFTEVDIHMQGGAHGLGAGFRFLKQAWYSIALWNYEHRVPAIAAHWWLQEENLTILRDPTMREFLCKDDVKPETFFQPRDIQAYGRNIIECVVKSIQDRVRAENDKPLAPSSCSDAPTPTTNAPAVESIPAESVDSPANTPPRELEQASTRASSFHSSRIPSTSAVADPQVIPFPVYEEPPVALPSGDRETRNITPSYDNPPPLIYGRKRGGRFSGGSNIRPSGYDGRQPPFQPRYIENTYPSLALSEMSTSSYTGDASAPKTAPGRFGDNITPTAAYSWQSAPPTQTAPYHNTRFPRQQNADHHMAISASFQPMAANNMPYNYVPHVYASTARHINHPPESHRFTSASNQPFDEPGYSSFFDMVNSARVGDARYINLSEGPGAPMRGSRPRGGRGRESMHDVPRLQGDKSNTRKPFYDHYSKSSVGRTKRRGSVYQENSWRSGSEHPQVENTLPRRVLSGPEQYTHVQGFHGGAGRPQAPPYMSATEHTMGFQGRHGSGPHQPPFADQPTHAAMPLDDEVDERYIGADATFATKLIVFGIPLGATENEIGNAFSRACDVHVKGVTMPRIPPKYSRSAHEPEKTLAFIYFYDHHTARRVLDLREVELFGMPLDVRVPRDILNMRGGQGQPYQSDIHRHHRATSARFIDSTNNFTRWPSGYPQDSSMSAQPGARPLPSISHKTHNDSMATGHMDGPPSTPSNRADRGERVFSTAPSVNTTPVVSNSNTPKKGNKKRNKNKTQAPPSSAAHDDMLSKSGPLKPLPREDTPVHGSRNSSFHQAALSSTNDPFLESKVDMKPSDQWVVQASYSTTDGSQSSQVAAIAKELQAEPLFALTTEPSSVPADDSSSQPAISAIKQTIDAMASPKSDAALISPLTSEVNRLRSFSPVSDVDRPVIVGRASESDHVDDSFHTASGSPDQSKQISGVSSSVREAEASSEPTPNSMKTPISEKPSRANLSISIQTPTPASKRPSSDRLKENESPKLNIQNDQSGHSKPGMSKSDKAPLGAEPDSRPDESDKLAPPALSVPPSVSVPPTPMTAYHTAPTTPAAPKTPLLSSSASQSNFQPKPAAKKGPSQTESFSMFGKKQKKQKKQTKAKGSVKGKQHESNAPAKLDSDDTSGKSNGKTMPAPARKKPALSIATNKSETIDTPTCKQGDVAASSEQSSPSKRTFGNLFGLLPGMITSPKLSDKVTSPNDTLPDDALTSPKVLPNDVPDQDEAFADTQSENPSPKDNESDANHDPLFDNFEFTYRSSDIQQLTLPSSSDIVKETTKKKKKKNKSKKQRRLSSNDGPINDEDDEDVSATESSSASNLPRVSNELQAGDHSEDSSTTMGEPTPPISPTHQTKSRKQLIEQSKSKFEPVLVPSPPRNRHIKRKVSSKSVTSPTETQTASATKTSSSTTQFARLMRMYQVDNSRNRILIASPSDDEDGGNSNVYVIANDEEGVSERTNRLVHRLFLPGGVISDPESGEQSVDQGSEQARVQNE